MSDIDYEQRITDICAAAGLDDLAPEMIAAGVAGNTLSLAIQTAQASGARNPRTAVRQHPGLAEQLAKRNDGATTAPVTGRGRPDGPTATTGWEAAVQKVAAEQQQPEHTAADAPAPQQPNGSWDHAVAKVSDEVLAHDPTLAG